MRTRVLTCLSSRPPPGPLAVILLMDSSYVVVGFEIVTAGDRVDKGQRVRVGREIRSVASGLTLYSSRTLSPRSEAHFKILCPHLLCSWYPFPSWLGIKGDRYVCH